MMRSIAFLIMVLMGLSALALIRAENTTSIRPSASVGLAPEPLVLNSPMASTLTSTSVVSAPEPLMLNPTSEAPTPVASAQETSTTEDSTGESESPEAPEFSEIERNRLYINAIENDALRAGCYLTFCDCGKLEYSGFVSSMHEDSCDTHRTYAARKTVHRCLTDKDCETVMDELEKGTFASLMRKLADYDLDNSSCSFLTSVCYGYLLKETVLADGWLSG